MRRKNIDLEKLEKRYNGIETRLIEIDSMIMQFSGLNPDLYNYVLFMENCSNIELESEMSKLNDEHKQKVLLIKGLFEEYKRLYLEYIKMSKAGYLNKINELRKKMCEHILIYIREVKNHKFGIPHFYCPKCCIDSLNNKDVNMIIETHSNGFTSDSIMQVQSVEEVDQFYMRAVEEGYTGEGILKRIKSLYKNRIGNPILCKK